ncbi:hypothetical protein ABIE38_003244 [Dietzia sp. 2505]|uniref:hypothetical protein n=1 Tax=Dietzia sp. 2505 TaxID=3156457 RepID=UPI0033957C2A
MKNYLAVFVAASLFVTVPAIASAQSSGSLGSVGGHTAPAVPTDHAPNPQEVETIAMLNQVVREIIAEAQSHLDEEDRLSVTLSRDADISRLAQYGAERAITEFAELDPLASGFYLNILDSSPGYRDTAVCGPAPLTVDSIGEVLRDTSSDNRVGDVYFANRYNLFTYREALTGVGYVEQDGLACSYTLLRSANHPFY